MASPNRDNALEKGMTFAFGTWTYFVDGSGGFTNHLANQDSVESNPTYQLPSNNSAAPVASAKNPPEDSREEENFDLIKRYWTAPEAMSHPRVDKLDLLDGIDHVSKKIA